MPEPIKSSINRSASSSSSISSGIAPNRAIATLYFPLASATCSCQNPSFSTAESAALLACSSCLSLPSCRFNAFFDFEAFFVALYAANDSKRSTKSAVRTTSACLSFKISMQFSSLAAALSLISIFLAKLAASFSFFTRSTPPGSTILARTPSAYSFFFVAVHL